MDKVYLNNLQSSPYVDEGLWDRVKARGAAGVQRYKGVTGMGWKPLDEARLDSLWTSFKKKVVSIVQDFNNNVVPNIQSSRPNDIMLHQKDFDNFKKLGKLLSPQQFTEPQLQKILSPRRYDDPTNLKPRGVNQGINFGEILREAGIGKFFRPFSLTQALMTNDTGRVIAAYKAYLKKLYTDFINDVKTILKLPDTTYAGRSVVTNKPEWKEALNKWEELAGVPVSEKAPSAEPSAAPSTEPPPSATPTAGTAPEPPKDSPADTGGKEFPEKPVAPSGKAAKLGGVNMDVIEAVVKLIINRIHKDPRADEAPHKYISRSIASWKQKGAGKGGIPDPTYDPATYKFSDYEPPKVPPPIKEADEQNKEKKDPGFLYTFAGNYRKYTGSFTQRIGTFKMGNTTYDVLWHSFSPGEKGHGHANEILVKVYDKAGKQPTTVRLFFFWDHEVDPRDPESSDFSIPKLFMNANPHLGNPFNAQDTARLAAFQEQLHKSLFAVTDRKTLEFKRALPDIGKRAMKTLIDLHKWDDNVENEDIVANAINKLISSGVASPSEKEVVDKALVMKGVSDDEGGIDISPYAKEIEDAIKTLIALDVGKGKKIPESKIKTQVLDAARILLKAGVVPTVSTIIAKVKSVPASSEPKPNPPASSKPEPKPNPPAEKPDTQTIDPNFPVVHNDGSVSWKDKVYQYPHFPPKTWLGAIEASGQMQKYKMILQAKKVESDAKKAAKLAAMKDKSKKKGLTNEFINPYNPTNFLLY